MEWAMLLVAAVLAAATVTTTHVLRRHPRVAAMPLGLDRRAAEERAIRDVEADLEAAHEAAESVAVDQHRRV